MAEIQPPTAHSTPNTNMPINLNRHHKAWVTIDLNLQADGITAEMVEQAIRMKIEQQEKTPLTGMEIVWLTKL